MIDSLLRVTTHDGAPFLSGTGIAGASVLTSTHTLLGVVVGIIESDLLVAPMDVIMAAEGLELASARDIGLYNQSIATKVEADRTDPSARAISKVLDRLNIKQRVGDWRPAVEEWIVAGWQLHLAGDSNAFTPYQAFFAGIGGDPARFAEILWEFGKSELFKDWADPASWEESLGLAYSASQFRDAEAWTHYPSNDGAIGSHDIVVRNEGLVHGA